MITRVIRAAHKFRSGGAQKFEIRSSKTETIFEIAKAQRFKTKGVHYSVSSFGCWSFEIVSGFVLRNSKFLLQHGRVKLLPVIQIIQVHGVFCGRRVISHSARAQDAFAGFIIVIISADRGVMLFDGIRR